jgi:hypothetical protein
MSDRIKLTRQEIWKMALDLRQNRQEFNSLSDVIDEINVAISKINEIPLD